MKGFTLINGSWVMQIGMLAGTIYMSIMYDSLVYPTQTFIIDYYGSADVVTYD